MEYGIWNMEFGIWNLEFGKEMFQYNIFAMDIWCGAYFF